MTSRCEAVQERLQRVGDECFERMQDRLSASIDQE